MFEAHVLYLLRRYLGQYVRGLSAEALQISVWKGDVVLKDLQLKAEALNALRLPLTVKAGFLGSVTLKIPWNKLGKDPVIVLLDRVFVLAEPVEDEQLFKNENMESWLDAKRSQIEELEMALLDAKAGRSGDDASPESKSWLGSLVATIIGNLKVSVTNLHIRYEDTLSNPSHRFCFGVTLAKLAAVTIDENDVETFVTSGALDKLHKSLQLDSFSIYHDSDTGPWTLEKRWDEMTSKEWSEMFEPSIKGKIQHKYLLHPVAGLMKYHRCGKREKRDSKTPFQKASLVLDQVSIAVSEDQYRDGIQLLEGVSRYRIRMEFSLFRPMIPVLVDAKAWWRYAGRAVTQQQRKSRCNFSWEHLSRASGLRKKYVDLYVSGLQQGKFDNFEIRQIDRELDVEVILLWRMLAHAKVETAKLKEAAAAREKSRKSTWWPFGGSGAGPRASVARGPETEAAPAQLTKEEWNKINELLSYQPGQDYPLLSTQEPQNMLQTMLDVTIKQSLACIKDSTDLVILCGTFSNLNVSLKLFPKTFFCDTKLTYYGLSSPEGPLVSSVSREGRAQALDLTFVYVPFEEHLDWKLSVTMSSCYVTVWRSSFDRVMHFMKSGQAMSPAVALETAVALQTKLEEVTRRAQEQILSQLEKQRRFSIDIDLDAPKVLIPALKDEGIGKKSQLLVDLGHFNLRTLGNDDVEFPKRSRYSKLHVSGRDISAFFVDGDFEWAHFPALATDAGDNAYSIFPVLDRCGMSIMLHMAQYEDLNWPSTCIAIEVPRLGIHFSPARYRRLLYLLHALESADRSSSQPNALSWQPSEASGDARVLLWGGIGNITAEWQPCWITLAGPYLYVLEAEDSKTYQRYCSLNGKQIVEIPPEYIDGSENVVAVCNRGIDLQKVIESSSAVVLQLKSTESKASWFKYLTLATYRSSASVSLLSNPEETSTKVLDSSKQLTLFVSGALKELSISVSGKIGKPGNDEIVIAELQASGGKVNLLQRPYDMKIAVKLHSLKIEDKLQGSVSQSCRYVARSVLSKTFVGAEEPQEPEAPKPDDDEQFKDAQPDFGGFSEEAVKLVLSWQPDQANFLEIWGSLDQLSEKAEGSEASDFVKVILVLRETESSEYVDTDTQMIMKMATLDFFCNRPTIVALIEFGMQLSEIMEAEESPSQAALSLEVEQRQLVKGLLGRGKSRVVFGLKMDMESTRIFLNLEDGSQLAMLAQEKFQMDLKVYPGSFTISGNLGNLRVCDMKLGPEHRWGWLCDIRNPDSGSLVEIEFQSFNRDDDDFEGCDYSLVGKFSAVRVVFLYRFIQEVAAYFYALASPQTQQIITVFDAAGGTEKIMQQADMDGAPALRLNLSMDTPIIIMPRSSSSKEFMEVDLGHLKLSNTFEWHGGSRDVVSAVHLDVLDVDISGVNMVVGIDGKAGKPMIQEAQGLHLTIRRPLRDLFQKVPEVQVDVQVLTLCGVMSDREYLVIIDCASTNINEPPDLPPNFRESTSSESDDQETPNFKSVELEEHFRDSQTYFTKVWVIVDVLYAELELFKGIERESPLARVEVHSFWLGYRFASTLETDIYVTLPKLSVVDLRPGTNAEMRMMFGSIPDVEKDGQPGESEHKSVTRLTMLVMDLRMKPHAQTIVIRMQRPRLLVVVDFLLEVSQFFVPSAVASTGDEEKDPLATAKHVRLVSSHYRQEEPMSIISPERQVIADAVHIQEFLYDGCDRVLELQVEDDYAGANAEPVIVVGHGKKLRFKNVKIKNGARIHECIKLASGASYSFHEEDGVTFVSNEEKITTVVDGGSATDPGSPKLDDRGDSNQDFLLDVQIVAPELTFYDSTKWPSSTTLSRQEKLLRAKMDFNLMFALKGENRWVRSFVKGLSVENSSGVMILDPLDISAEYVCAQGKSNILVTASDVFLRPSFNVMRLVMRLHSDAVARFHLDRGVIHRCTHFDRIWVNKPGNTSSPEVTFWRPKVPPGYVILSDCVTSGTAPPSQGVVAVFNSHHRVKKPLKFDLVWSSYGNSSNSVLNEEPCCVWLPVAPPGYKAVGCVAERGTSPPSLNTVHCVRSDLLTSSAVTDCVLCIPPGDRDYADGCSIWRVDNTIGSFFARSSVNPPQKDMLCDLRHLVLNHLSSPTERTDDAVEVKVVERTPHPAPRASRNSLTTPQFERLWWDRGTETRRVVSIWRPIPASGYAIVGDSIVDGLEPPGIGLVLRDDGTGRLCKPIRFQQKVHICGRGLEDVYIWYPVAPAGYVALGCVATTTPDHPPLDMVRCVRMDLVSQGSLSKRPVWSYIGSRGGHSCCLWKVENQASTFIARADLKKPLVRMAYFLAETGRPKVRENLTAEMKLGRLSVTVVDDLSGMATPLVNATLTGVNLAAHGRPDALNAVALTSIAASTFNASLDAWEPLIEPFDGILKYEFYGGDSDATLKIGRRVRITAASTVSINITSASLEALIGAMAVWQKQTESEQEALSAMRTEKTDYKAGMTGKAALEEDDSEKLVVQNMLFSELYLRTFRSGFENVEVLQEGETSIIPLPPPSFPDKLASGVQKPSRQFVAVHVLEAKGLLVNDDGNCPDFLCALRLVTTKQLPEDPKALPQSARSRCVRPNDVQSLSRASASWNEVFIFEVPSQGSVNLEVVITNQAARSGKGEAVGILSLPVKEEASHKVSQPSTLWKMVRQSISQESWPAAQAKILSLRPPRKRGNIAELQSQECGNIAVQLYFFSTAPDWRRDKDEKLPTKDYGLLFSCRPDGPWESLRCVLPFATIPKTVGEQQVAVDVTMDQGRKHATFRSLVIVANNTDMALEVAICPYSLLHTPNDTDGGATSLDNSTRVDEECFENQRYQPLAGWGSKWPGHLIPTDPGRWSTRDFTQSSQEILKVQLPPGWIWTSDWTVDLSGNVDQDGWFYGPDFQSLRTLPVSSKASRKSTFDFVRRRRWIRTRQRVPDNKKAHKREVVGVIQPGSSIQLPLASTARQADYCAQVRPVTDTCGSYLWGRLISDPNPIAANSSTPRKSIKQSKSNISSQDFTLGHLEKREQLLLCVTADMTSSKGHCWLSMEADATILSGDLNTQIYDWRLSVNAPLRLENLLPCNAEYIIWEKINEARPVKRQHGIASAGDSVCVYAADIRRQIFLTWLPQGGWRPEKEGVLIFDPKSEDLPLGFWMVHHASNRRLRVSLEYDFGSSLLAAKTVRLLVPYWISNDTGLPLAYRVVEVESSEPLSTPKGTRNSKLATPARKARMLPVTRVLDVIESSPAPLMLSPHAQLDRLGPLPNTPRVEDVLSPRIGLAVSAADSDNFKYGFSFRELEDNKDLIVVKAYDSNGGYVKLTTTLDLSSERTKVVRFQPHSVFINRLGKRLQIRQGDIQAQDFLYPNQTPKTFVWRTNDEPELLKVYLEGYKWSPPFNIETIGTTHLKLTSTNGSSKLYIRIEVRSGSRHASQLVIFRYASIHGPYRIENKSTVSINYRQEGTSSESWQHLPAGSCDTFAWEDLDLPRMLEINVEGADPHSSQTYKIDEARTHQLITSSSPGPVLQVKVHRDGAIHLVSVTNSITRPEDMSIVPVSSSSTQLPERTQTSQAENQFHTSIELAELGLSIVDHTPEELLYLSVINFFVSYSTGLGSQISRFKVKVDGLQVDNQLPLTPMPVLFSPQDTAKNCEFLLKFTVTLKENSLSDQQVYPYIGIQGPNVPNVSFLVNIHEPIIWRLHEMFTRLNLGQLRSSQTTAVALDPIISIGLLNTSEIRFKVTLAMSPTQRPRGVLGFWSTLLTSLGNTDDMPVRITPHVHENICMSQSALVAAAIASVRNDMLSQPLKLLSGVDLLGNASSALGHMSKGVAALSMDKKFIRSRQKHETKAAVEDIGDGIREGGEALAKGFFRGVTGILTKPLEGARSAGVEGFLQGVGKGVIGAAVQPMSGVLDLLSKTTEGANATRMKLAAVLTSEEQLRRRRLPRVIGGDNILRPYDEYKAQGQVLLQLAQRGTLFGPVDIFKIRGKFAASDAYEDHFNLPKARTLIITHRRVILLQHPTGILVQKKPDLLKNPCTIVWDVTWGELMTMELAIGKQETKEPHEPKPSRLILHLRTSSQETSIFDTRETMRVVKCHPGTNQAAEIMASIQRAYETFGPERAAIRSETMKLKPGSRPYAGSSSSAAPALGLLAGPAAPVSIPMLATFGALLGSAHRSSLLAKESDAATDKVLSIDEGSSTGSPRAGRFISDFDLIWSNQGDPDGETNPMSIWRPACLSGYATVGDVAHAAHDQPESVLVYPLSDQIFLHPQGFDQVWREQGPSPLTIWRPRAPPGYVSVGCVAVADFYEPEVEVVFCVLSKHTTQAVYVEPALVRSPSPGGAAFLTCRFWRVANEARTFVVPRDDGQPPSSLACMVVL
ncbi:uncharacterized protein LOC9648284 isoform X1 [Selaginella moellendorffii]|uniref:uncharacterized protein LOC9648284 isoform X1 n=1 Tax=Selaginella moellendorffii TaxID=88036 RepID=UPI000D1D0102|nr:uncharacterized protein LOC9648284 isoform X1 [Selaginella moellendorffii]|eukprot:XP_024542530.1 uncharacterized protein LOC9648284 isoform X1 [Selaginella moellendorffii]